MSGSTDLNEDALIGALHEYRRCSEDQARGIIAAYLALAAREEPQKDQLQVVVDFLDAWRYCPVASADSPSRECLEKAAREILTALADAREDTERPDELEAKIAAANRYNSADDHHGRWERNAFWKGWDEHREFVRHTERESER